MSDKSVTIDGHTVELSNLDKVLFPNSGISKADLIDYYRRIAKTALPHYRGRPLSMERYPDGIARDGFFQKDIPDYFPRWINRATLKKEDGAVTHAVVNNAASLVFIANQGCITPHLGLSRTDKIQHPDRLIFDLDPPDGNFRRIQAAAKAVKGILDAVGLHSFVQTTGSRGLHVVVPLDRSADFDTVRAFARTLAERLAARHPKDLTVEQRKNKRQDRVFLDYLRNAYGQTSAAPYGVRAREGAPVATPLDWSEVGRKGLTAQTYTVRNIFRRLARKKDPWRNIMRYGQPLQRAQRRLDFLGA